MAWTVAAEASDGSRHESYQQDVNCGCGPASVATLILLMQNKKVDVSTIGRWFAESEGSKYVTKEGIRDFTRSGSWYDGVIGALSTLGIYAHATKGLDNAAKWAAKVRPNKPGILSIGWYLQDPDTGYWNRRGGHWVVATNVFNNNLICLDPLLSDRANEFPVAGLPQYECDYGTGPIVGWADGIVIP